MGVQTFCFADNPDIAGSLSAILRSDVDTFEGVFHRDSMTDIPLDGWNALRSNLCWGGNVKYATPAGIDRRPVRIDVHGMGFYRVYMGRADSSIPF